MPLPNYGLLTGAVVDHAPQHGGNPHYLLFVQTQQLKYRVSVNLESTRVAYDPPALEVQIVDDLRRSSAAARTLVGHIANNKAFVLAEQDPSLPTLDYVRGGVVDMGRFETLARGAVPRRSRFSRELIKAAARAKQDAKAFVAVLGTGYPDQDDRRGQVMADPRQASFGFTGVDNVHMNQGSFHRVGRHLTGHFAENGPSQDGAVLFFFSDGTIQGFFAKFASQDVETDPFGNPVHTGIARLDDLEAIPAEIRKLVARKPRFTVKAAKAQAAAVEAHRRGAAPPPAPAPPAAAPAKETGGAGGFIFAEPNPADDPNLPFKPDDDSQYRFSPFVENFAKYGVPEPVVGPRGGIYPTMRLADVIGTEAEAKIVQAKKIVFHSVGDTGAPEVGKLTDEDSVASLMVGDFTTAGGDADRPKFFFHLGDVVYYYGEEHYYYSQFYKPYRDYPAPIFAIPGNHDGITYRPDMVSLDGFINAFCQPAATHWNGAGGLQRTTMTQPGPFFTLDAPFVSIIGLYSNCSESQGYLDSQQSLFFYHELQRLKPVRESGRVAAVLLAVHHPPVSASPAKPGSVAMRDVLDQACQQAGFWPDAVLSGHAHVYQRLRRTVAREPQREIPYIVSGSGGYTVQPKQELKLNDPQFQLDQFFPNFGYLLVTVEPGRLRVEFHSPELKSGAAADTCIVDLAQHRVLK
jgi:uncharacterized protein YukJ